MPDMGIDYPSAAGNHQIQLPEGCSITPTRLDGSMVHLKNRGLHPRRHDRPVCVVIPAGVNAIPTEPCLLAVARRGAKIAVIRSPQQNRDRSAILVNWGSRDPMPRGTLNSATSVELSRNKIKNVCLLAELAPMTVFSPDAVGQLPGDRLVAKRRFGQQGSGKMVLPLNSPRESLCKYDIFQEFIANRTEYRVSVIAGTTVVTAMLKTPASASPEDLTPHFSFTQLTELPAEVARVAISAAERIGLGYTGVDVIRDNATGRILCLETNSAPGMSTCTIINLYEILQGRDR